jgi:hypothetical protein
MRLLLALLGVALVAAGPSYHPIVDTRADCPPEGFTALSSHARLDRLPAGGKYAICQTAAQALAGGGTWNPTGVFRMRNSELIVDAALQIVFEYPARPDWVDVAVKGFPGDTDNSNVWNGISIRGAPSDELLEAAHHPHWPVPLGNCGDLDTVVIDEVSTTQHSLIFDHCTHATTVKKVTTFSGDLGVAFFDSKEIVVQDSFFAGVSTGVPNDGRRLISGWVGVKTARSQIGFTNLVIYGGDSSASDALEVTDGSSVTICNLFAEVAVGIQIGSFDAGTTSSSLAIAGVTNLYLGDNSLGFQGVGGVVFTLRDCPAVMSDAYDMGLWLDFWTTGTPGWM